MAKFNFASIKKTVCVFAHPDDESFGPSGTIAKLTKNGDVHVVCVTDGSLGGHAKALRETRRKELIKASDILGVNEVHFLDYKDGSLSNSAYHNVAGDLAKIIKRLTPDTLVTFEPRGVTGHIDHVFVSMVTSFIFRQTKFVRNLLYFCNPKSVDKYLKNYFIYAPPGFSESDIDLVVDVSETQKQKERAIFCHKSQIKDALIVISFLKTIPKKELFQVLTK